MSGTYDHPNLSLHGRFVPDELSKTEQGSSNPREPGADAYEIGVEIEGVFVPIYRRRSGEKLRAQLEQARASRPASPPPDDLPQTEG